MHPPSFRLPAKYLSSFVETVCRQVLSWRKPSESPSTEGLDEEYGPMTFLSQFVQLDTILLLRRVLCAVSPPEHHAESPLYTAPLHDAFIAYASTTTIAACRAQTKVMTYKQATTTDNIARAFGERMVDVTTRSGTRTFFRRFNRYRAPPCTAIYPHSSR